MQKYSVMCVDKGNIAPYCTAYEDKSGRFIQSGEIKIVLQIFHDIVNDKTKDTLDKIEKLKELLKKELKELT